MRFSSYSNKDKKAIRANNNGQFNIRFIRSIDPYYYNTYYGTNYDTNLTKFGGLSFKTKTYDLSKRSVSIFNKYWNTSEVDSDIVISYTSIEGVFSAYYNNYPNSTSFSSTYFNNYYEESYSANLYELPMYSSNKGYSVYFKRYYTNYGNDRDFGVLNFPSGMSFKSETPFSPFLRGTFTFGNSNSINLPIKIENTAFIGDVKVFSADGGYFKTVRVSGEVLLENCKNMVIDKLEITEKTKMLYMKNCENVKVLNFKRVYGDIGIKMENCNLCTIKDSHLSNNNIGIQIINSFDNIISNIIFKDTKNQLITGDDISDNIITNLQIQLGKNLPVKYEYKKGIASTTNSDLRLILNNQEIGCSKINIRSKEIINASPSIITNNYKNSDYINELPFDPKFNFLFNFNDLNNDKFYSDYNNIEAIPIYLNSSTNKIIKVNDINYFNGLKIPDNNAALKVTKGELIDTPESFTMFFVKKIKGVTGNQTWLNKYKDETDKSFLINQVDNYLNIALFTQMIDSKNELNITSDSIFDLDKFYGIALIFDAYNRCFDIIANQKNIDYLINSDTNFFGNIKSFRGLKVSDADIFIGNDIRNNVSNNTFEQNEIYMVGISSKAYRAEEVKEIFYLNGLRDEDFEKTLYTLSGSNITELRPLIETETRISEETTESGLMVGPLKNPFSGKLIVKINEIILKENQFYFEDNSGFLSIRAPLIKGDKITVIGGVKPIKKIKTQANLYNITHMDVVEFKEGFGYNASNSSDVLGPSWGTLSVKMSKASAWELGANGNYSLNATINDAYTRVGTASENGNHDGSGSWYSEWTVLFKVKKFNESGLNVLYGKRRIYNDNGYSPWYEYIQQEGGLVKRGNNWHIQCYKGNLRYGHNLSIISVLPINPVIDQWELISYFNDNNSYVYTPTNTCFLRKYENMCAFAELNGSGFPLPTNMAGGDGQYRTYTDNNSGNLVGVHPTDVVIGTRACIDIWNDQVIRIDNEFKGNAHIGYFHQGCYMDYLLFLKLNHEKILTSINPDDKYLGFKWSDSNGPCYDFTTKAGLAEPGLLGCTAYYFASPAQVQRVNDRFHDSGVRFVPNSYLITKSNFRYGYSNYSDTKSVQLCFIGTLETINKKNTLMYLDGGYIYEITPQNKFRVTYYRYTQNPDFYPQYTKIVFESVNSIIDEGYTPGELLKLSFSTVYTERPESNNYKSHFDRKMILKDKIISHQIITPDAECLPPNLMFTTHNYWVTNTWINNKNGYLGNNPNDIANDYWAGKMYRFNLLHHCERSAEDIISVFNQFN